MIKCTEWNSEKLSRKKNSSLILGTEKFHRFLYSDALKCYLMKNKFISNSTKSIFSLR